MGLLISARSAFRVAPTFDYKRPHFSATTNITTEGPLPFSTLSAMSGALYRDQGKNDRGRKILVVCMAILIGSCSQGTEAIKLVVEKGEIILALAAVEIVRNCCGSLFLLLFFISLRGRSLENHFLLYCSVMYLEIPTRLRQRQNLLHATCRGSVRAVARHQVPQPYFTL